MKKYKTSQENFWVGDFGNEYIKRNNSKALNKNKLVFYSGVLKGLRDINSVIEFGSNIGLNLIAINKILPRAEISAIEINAKAVSKLRKIKDVKIYHTSIFDFKPDYKRDFVLISGVLIHLKPNLLNVAYDLLYKTSKKYILIAEYYNPTPVTVNYRGYKNKLFKRDFAGEMLDKFKDLKLINYGFRYHREDKYNGDATWFLLEKILGN